jgi:filamentous hemagglutinin family protein
MNSKLYKVIFSKRLNALVVVGENCVSTGKSISETRGSEASSALSLIFTRFIGALCLGFVLVSTAFADPAANALPLGGVVAQGAATISQTANTMDINQATSKAIVNWQGFDIGAAATVNVIQPSNSSVLLSRVVGNNPSQIFGLLNANGQVVLINPNGITFGADGSINASAFTASTLDMHDADFMSGNYRFFSTDVNGEIVNQGGINTTGYVALLGAKVTNNGVINSHGGNVYLGAGQSVIVPVSNSGRIKMELSPASINAAVENTKNGIIVTAGGQVYMQASALNDLVASLANSGQIDTSAAQAGDVAMLADGGQIKVDGIIKANSTLESKNGGDIIIGRDISTGVLAKATDVSAAILESSKGFVETSGDFLKVDNIKVKASEWLLDPTNITIAATGTPVSGTAYVATYTAATDSVILASSIEDSLNLGTSVTIATSATGASAGNIAVNESIAKTAGTFANLTLRAHGDITLAAGKTITATSGKLNVLLNSDSDASGFGSIVFNSGSGVTSNGGNITLGGGTALNGTGFAIADGSNTLRGISLNTATMSAGGGNIVMNGLSPTTSATNVVGILMAGGTITTSGAGQITLTGKNQLTGTTGATGTGFSMSSGTISGGSTGAVTIEGNSSTSSATSINNKGTIINGTVTSTGGDISVTGFGGAGAQFDNGVDIGGSVLGVGSANITISGTAASGSSGGNVGVTTSGTARISSVNGNINITGTGGVGNGTTIRNHGVSVGSSNAIQSTGSGSVTVTGRAINNDTNFSQGVVIGGAGLRTNSGNIKVDGQVLNNYQVAVNISAAVTATTGNVYIRSVNAGITNSAAGVISGNNVSIENTAGTIDANGVITPGAGGATTWAGQVARNGIDLNGSVTAANNLNIYGNQTNTEVGVKMSGATTTISGKDVTLYGKSSSGNGVLLSGATLSGKYINATGTTNTGYTGFSWNGGNINTTGTDGTSTASIIKGTSAASTTASNGYGAFMMFANGATNAAAGTTLTLAGEATTLSSGQNTKERGILVQSGRTLTMSGDVTLNGSSKSSEGISFGGTINMATVAGVTNKLTIKGTSAASSNAGLNAVNLSGTITSNAATSGINIIGDAKNLSGTNWDKAVNISGAINGGTSNVNIQSTGGHITNSAAITGANISIDNTNGSIDSSTGVITAGIKTAGSAIGIQLGAAVTASNNLNVYGASSGNIGLRLVSSVPISGANIQATGKTTNGANGVLLNGTNTISTTGSSGDSLIKGITTAGGTNALLAWGGLNLNSATGTTLTLWGDGTNTSDRAARFDGGGTTTGAVTLKGTSNNATALMLINGAVTANANSALTLSGVTAGSAQSGVYFVNNGGVGLSNGATLNITGQNTNAAGAGSGVSIAGAGITKAAGATSAGAVSITGSTSSASGSTGVDAPSGVATDGNIVIQGTVASSSSTGVNIAGAVNSSGTATTINVNSNYAITNSGAISVSGATGTGASINLSSTNAGISGLGTIGSTTNKNESVIFTQAGTSTYSGAINAANFTKAGVGALTLSSWKSTPIPILTNVSNAYNVNGGGLTLDSDSATLNYPTFAPAEVNVVNASSFSLTSSSNGRWNGTAFNFTGGLGGGSINFGGNPIGAANTTNSISTSGGATNNINGGFNGNGSNVTLNLTTATSGAQLLDGSYAALNFATGYAQTSHTGLSGNTVNVSGGGSLLVMDKIAATNFNVAAGNVQFGTNATETTSTTPVLAVTNVNIAAGTTLAFNKSATSTNSSIYTGTGNLIQAGTGVVTLTGNSSAFAGATTVNSGKTLAIGTGGSLGAVGSTLTLTDSVSRLQFTEVSGTSIVASTISGAGTVSHTGAGTGVLVADNSYDGITTVSGGTLQVGNAGATGTLGGGDVTLSNNANLNYLRSAATTIANNISGTGNVSATITGDANALTVDRTINLTNGNVNLVTDGDLLLSKAINTTNTTSSAIFLEAGKPTSAGTSTGGDVQISGTGALTVGAGGRATVMTGSIAGSTGLTALVGSGSGNFRYNSDEVATNYSTALGAGSYAIYREAPTASLTMNDATKTYDGFVYTGGNGYTLTSGGVNGDTATQVGAGVVYGGTSQTAKNVGTHSIAGGGSSALGYTLSYADGTLTVNQVDLIVTATEVTKIYDGTLSAIGTGNVGTLAGNAAGETVNSAGSQVFLDKNYGAGDKAVRASGVTIKNSGNENVTSNYNISYVDNTTSTINKADLIVTATEVTKTYDGTLSASDTGTVGTLAGDGDSVSAAGSQAFLDKNYGVGNKVVRASGVKIKDSSNDDMTGNYNISYVDNTTSTINKAALTAALTGTVEKVYDGTLSASNLSNSNFAVTGWVSVEGASEGASVIQTNATYDSKNVSANGGTGGVSATLAANQFTANAGTSLGNYTLPTTAIGAVGKITPAALNIKVNNSSTFVTLDPSAATDNGFSYTGFKNGETAATVLVGMGTRTYTGTDNPIAGDYVNVYGLSATPTANNDNYTISVSKGDLKVIPATELLITIGGKTETYGVLNAANAGASATSVLAQYCLGSCITGLVNLTVDHLEDGSWKATDSTDTSVTFNTLIDSTEHLSTGGYLKVGSYNYDASATTPSSTGNFTGSSVSGGVLTIQAKTLVLSANGVTKVYDGNQNIGLTTLASDAKTGDDVSASATSGLFVSKNAGTRDFTLNGVSLSGDDASNYAVNSGTLNGSGTINAKEVALTATDVTKVYDGLLGYTTTSTELDALSAQLGVVGDTVTAATIAYLDKNAGAGNKAVLLNNVTVSDDNSGSNYSLTLAGNKTSTITKKDASITGTTTNVTYNSAIQNQDAAVLSGFIAADVTNNTVSATGIATGRNAGTYTSSLTATGADKDNYTITVTNKDLVIAKKEASITGTLTNVTYNSATQNQSAAVLDGFIAADVTGGSVSATGEATGRNAGTYASNLSATGTDKDNYNITVTNNNLVIAKQLASITGTLTNVTYNSLTQNQSAALLTGFIAADVTSGSVSATGEATGRNAGTYASNLSATGADKDNYTITVTNNDLVIAKKNASITGATTNVTYNSATQYQGAAVLDGFIAADVTNNTVGATGIAAGTTGIAAGRNAGTYASTLSATGADKGNYNITINNRNLVIAKKDASITGTLTNVTYNSAMQNQGAAVLDGFIAADVTNNTVGATGIATGRNAGTYASTLSATGLDIGNYNVTVINKDLVIAKKDLAISATASDKVYDTKTDATASLTSDMLLGDSLTLANTSANFDDKNVGTGKTVTVAGLAIYGTDAGNYNLTNSTTTTTADITKKDLVISATATDKVYDTTTDATATLSSDMLSGDSLSLNKTGATFDTKNVGAGKTVTVAGLAIYGTDAGNYNLTNSTTTTTADITKKDLVISAIATDKVYDTTTDATAVLTSDMLTGDSLTLSKTGATFDTKNVGTGKTVTVAGLSIDGTDAGNYNLTNSSATTTADITKKDLVISATATDKVYDTTTAATATLSSDMLTGDSLTLSKTGATFDTKNVGAGKTVTVAGLAIDGTDAGNYNLTNSTTTTTADITKKDLVISATATDKVYDTTTAATATLSSDMLTGDSLTLSKTGATFDTKNVGTGKTVTVAGLAIDGTDAGNYNLTNSTTTTTADITKKDLAISATATDKVYDTTTAATATLSSDMLTGDSLTLANTSANFDDKNVGTGKTVTVAGLSIDGTDAGNYNLTNSTAITTASIEKATLQLQVDGVTKVYDGTKKLEGMALTPNGVLANDEVTVVASAGNFDTKDVGQDIGFTLSDLTLTGSASGNYILANSKLSGLGSINPKQLTMLGSIAKDKVFDGNTQAVVVAGTLNGLVLNETLVITTNATFADSAIGSNKLVFSSYALANGLNGGLASNYILADEKLTASITSNRPIVNPVAPVIPVSPSGNGGASSRVSIPNGQVQTKIESLKQCSIENPEQCECKETLITGVSLCVLPFVVSVVE